MRKTTSMMNFAHPLLNQVGGLTDGPTFFTKELLTQRLIQSPDSSIYLMVGEFAELVQKNKPGEMYDFLTSMYDSRESLEVGTMARGVEKALRPCLNMFAATTPAWIAENMTAGVIGGGFASRIIFVYEERLRNPKLIFTELMDQFGEDDRSADLLNDLQIIAGLVGEFEFTPEMEEYLNKWVQTHSMNPPSDPRMQGYHSRKPMMMLKLAMIYSAATRNELVIDMESIMFAEQSLMTTEVNLPKVFGGIGKNEYVFDMDAIVGYVIIEKSVSHEQLVSKFKSVAQPVKLQELIQGCVAMGEIQMEMKDKGVWYSIPGK